VQGDFDVQLARSGVIARGRVVAQHGAGIGEDGTAVLHRGQRGAVLARLGEDELEVVVKPRAHKPGQLGAGQGEPHEAGADGGAPHHLEAAGLQGVADAFDGKALRCGAKGSGSGGRQRRVHDLKC